MQEKSEFKAIVDKFFNVSSDNAVSQTRSILHSIIRNKKGASSLYGTVVKYLGIPLMALNFSNVLHAGDQQLLLNNGTYIDLSYLINTSTSDVAGNSMINNGIFTVTTYLTHYWYSHARDIEENCKKIGKLYEEFSDVCKKFDAYSDKGNDEEYRRFGDIIVTSFELALAKRGIASLSQLNDYRVAECTLNMAISMTSFLMEIKRTQKQTLGNNDTLFSEKQITTMIELATKEYAEIIASAVEKRNAIKNIFKFYAPNHVHMTATPTKDNFHQLLKASFEKVTNSIASSKEWHSENYEESNIGSDYEEVSADGTDELSDYEIKVEKDVALSATNYEGAISYAEFLAPSNNRWNTCKNSISYITQRVKQGTVTSEILKFFTCAAAGTAYDNPIANNTSMAWYFKYLCSALIIGAGFLFHSIYTKIESQINVSNKVYDRFEEVLKNLLAHGLLMDKENGNFLEDESIKQIRKIIGNTFLNMHNNNRKATGEEFAVIYSALASTLLQEKEKAVNFNYEGTKKDIEISNALANEILATKHKKLDEHRLADRIYFIINDKEKEKSNAQKFLNIWKKREEERSPTDFSTIKI